MELLGKTIFFLSKNIPFSFDHLHLRFDLSQLQLPTSLFSFKLLNLSLFPFHLLSEPRYFSSMLFVLNLPMLLMLSFKSGQLRGHQLVVAFEKLVLCFEGIQLGVEGFNSRVLRRGELVLQVEEHLRRCFSRRLLAAWGLGLRCQVDRGLL